ncbi:MAG TPA: polymer-forming cytoskeletal protein [Rhizomicrobium sp.]|jgi:cytoskeletal protein CcmA (bactofilin family)|nr:polymer-forming cytoskeletal protein [Rhizomicrobium sp.]
MFAPSRRPAPARDTSAFAPSCLAPGFVVVGVLESDADLEIHGAVHGRINGTRVVIAESGLMRGDIVADEVTVAGRLDGRIFATKVTVEDTAHIINGRIFHNVISVARGARFEGRMPWRPPSYFETLDQLPEPTA